MNINALNNINTLLVASQGQATTQPTVKQSAEQIAVGEPYPSQPPIQPLSQAQRAMTASYYYIAAMMMNSLDKNQAAASFQVKNWQTDELGMTHVRMEQVVNGLKVYGQEIITHVNSNGKVESMTGNYQSELLDSKINTQPAIKAESALRRVRSDYHAALSSPKVDLLLYPTEKHGTRLAYKVEFFDTKAPARMTYFVDARNGRILDKSNSLTTYGTGINRPVAATATTPAQGGYFTRPTFSARSSESARVIAPVRQSNNH